jgi:hypothetical protein
MEILDIKYNITMASFIQVMSKFSPYSPQEKAEFYQNFMKQAFLKIAEMNSELWRVSFEDARIIQRQSDLMHTSEWRAIVLQRELGNTNWSPFRPFVADPELEALAASLTEDAIARACTQF